MCCRFAPNLYCSSSLPHCSIPSQRASPPLLPPSGFDDAVYHDLLARLQADGDVLAGQPIWVRTTAPIPDYEPYALEEGKSATWYRNHVPPGHALVLIFNRHTTDAQSLKDIYLITESLLATKGLEHLIRAAFTDYQPSPSQLQVLDEFLDRLRRNLFQPNCAIWRPS